MQCSDEVIAFAGGYIFAKKSEKLVRVGSCRDGIMRFEQASDPTAWAEWVIDTTLEKPTLQKTFYYWNEGTIASAPIELTAQK